LRRGKEAHTVSDELLVAADGAVRIVTINRPQSHNVIDESVHSQLDIWHDLDRDADARCVVLEEAMRLAARLAARPARALQTTKRAFSKHVAQAALAIVDYGLAAETLELGGQEHIDKVREFLGADKYDAIDVPRAEA
jgi:enoyl-CoA hydratase/carnithine racemase